jgi:hypothetical protein
MDWFSSFFTTKAMFDRGYKVRSPIYDLAARQGVRPIKYGDEYSLYYQKEAYARELAEYEQSLSELEGEEKEEYIADGYAPSVPLQPWTWSLAMGPLEGSEKHEQIAKFDVTTLFKIVADRLDPIPAEGVPIDHAKLVKLVENIVYNEYNTAEMALEYHPVLELMSGVICLGNSKWLSKSDAGKFIDAYDAYSMDNVIEKQVEMLQEMVDKNQTGNGSDSRYYDRPRSILQDNKRTLHVPTAEEDEPEGRKRRRVE